ncbi:methylated-DNA-[protein]-cysteine S-methyltransferase [Rhodotorula toruloides NP11]|uniref:Methylated-DNA--protein-cysteine methyltransferase n=1 Tax=Rhodotorula toruloides (strain NP11) TaxID=1130832 RepID=M7XZ53_RHOT1|nr:methylated-DNA-[protein]-cysteine S-methyltransferase [Rhodotorula toruloides NP11]EMS25593.1 methylated-DNA-[protein]-cysteine S-methyltransferase [Rhodotorula toruloides NP11]
MPKVTVIKLDDAPDSLEPPTLAATSPSSGKHPRVKQVPLDALLPYNKVERDERSARVKAEKQGASKRDEDADAATFVIGRVPPPFPLSAADRLAFVRPAAREGERKAAEKVTAFQWKLYDLLLTIPEGRVSTYGQLASLLASSPRAVGSALRSNPFAPYVPCHRIIASTLFIGGFCGEWTGKNKSAGAKQAGEGKKTGEKIELLRREGVEFDSKGYLKDKSKLWDGKKA